jgi:hypothetical protein
MNCVAVVAAIVDAQAGLRQALLDIFGHGSMPSAILFPHRKQSVSENSLVAFYGWARLGAD